MEKSPGWFQAKNLKFRNIRLIMKKRSSEKLVQYIFLPITLFAVGSAPTGVRAQDSPAGDVARGRAYFQAACTLCHANELGPDNTVVIKQGPSLVGVMGRQAGSLPHFTYTDALKGSGYTWNAA